MKRLALVIAFLFIAQSAFASVYVIYKSDTKAVYSISPEDDATMPEKGYDRMILNKNIEDIQLQYPFTYYFYKDGKFVVNTEKVKADIEAEIAAQDKAKEEALIRDKIREMALKELQAEGKIK